MPNIQTKILQVFEELRTSWKEDEQWAITQGKENPILDSIFRISAAHYKSKQEALDELISAPLPERDSEATPPKGESMLLCPKCGRKLAYENFGVSEVTEGYVEIEVYCGFCECAIFFVRIRPEDWIATIISEEG